VCQTLSVLIILGGLGFPVIHELALRALTKARGHRPRRLSLNTRVALVTSAALFAALSVS
jgi:trk system potassium uptake protein TrkH